jgi:hypothetical protein
MNALLLEAVDSLINEDEDKAAQCIKQALIQKMQTKMGINESQDIDESEDEDQLNEDEFIDDLEDDESFDD